MQLSTRGRYAVMAMVELAARPAGEPVSLAVLAESQQLSQTYLEQLFLKLRRAGLVVSVRGPAGGYHLSRPNREIAIAAIIDAVEENLDATRCVAGGEGCIGTVGRRRKCQTHDLWHELGRQVWLFLAGITLEDVVMQRVCGRAAPLAPRQPPALHSVSGRS